MRTSILNLIRESGIISFNDINLRAEPTDRIQRSS